MWVLIYVGGGTSLGSILLGILLLCPAGLALSVEDYKEWNSIEKAAEAALLPPDSYYESLWYNNRAITHFQRGNYRRAIQSWKKSYECYPEASVLNLIAATYYSQGDLDTAIDYWSVAVEAYPEFELLRKNLENAEKAREQNPSWKPTLTIAREE